MKKAKSVIITGILAASLALGATACGSSAPAAPETAAPETAAPETAAPETAAPETAVVEEPENAAQAEQVSASADDIVGAPTYKLVANDGMVSVEAPNSTWRVAPSESADAAFSDGTCAVMFMHFPADTDIIAAKPTSHCPYVYEEVITLPDSIAVLKGYASTESELVEVAEIVRSAQIDFSKIKEEKPEQHKEEGKINPDIYSVEDVEKTMYCNTSSLTVRASGITNSDALGAYKFGEPVKVTGIVKKNGQENGWVRVNYNGEKGYCAACYLSDKAVDAQKTGNSMQLFFENSNSVTVYEYTDGTWRDDEGLFYDRINEKVWGRSDGANLYKYDPGIQDADDNEGQSWTVNVAKNYLALRSYPNNSDDVEIGKLYNGMQVSVINKYDQTYWYVHSDDLGMDGYVNSNFLTK